MTYCTLDQLIDRYSEQLLLDVADRAEPPAGTVDAGVVARALTDTDAMIDGYLAVRYALPITGDVPPALADLAQSIAIYKLHRWAPDEKIKTDYELALKQLDRIQTGAFRLPLQGVEPAAKSGSGVLTNDRERPFTEENLKGYI